MKVFNKKGNYIGVPYIRLLYHFCKTVFRYFPRKDRLGHLGTNSILEYPVFFDNPRNVFVDNDVINSTPPYSVVMGSPASYDANKRIKANELDRIFEEYHYDEIKTHGNNTPLNLEEQQVLEKYKLELNFIGIN